MNDINKDDLMEIESLVFKRLTKHLQDNPEVQNIDLMNLANFCRNCLSKSVSYTHLTLPTSR